MLAGAGEEDEFIKCFDDITGKELFWQAVKEAREKELKYLRELGVCEKSMSAQLWQCTTSRQSTQSGSTVTEHSRGSRCKSVHGLLPERTKVETGQTCMKGLPHWCC